MQWDEDVFGLECDLDLYNIVATNDFNMGAMYVILSFLSFQISLENSVFNNHFLYLIKQTHLKLIPFILISAFFIGIFSDNILC